MRLLYKIATRSYVTAVKGASLFSEKAKKWVLGRKDLKRQLEYLPKPEGPLIWFHCSSLGEFEQGKPVMEAFKLRHPSWEILVTFFSPSGYEVQKDTEVADFVMYLPIENKQNIRLFLDYFEPKIAVFVKYEFWYDYMIALHDKHVPLIFISSSFRETQLFFRPYGGWFLKQLKSVEMFFVQDIESKNILERFGIVKVEVSGDTRFDRVLNTLSVNEDLPIVAEFKGDSKVLIFGSAWETETRYALSIIAKLPENWKVIFAPHEVDEDSILDFERQLSVSFTRFSNGINDSIVNSKVLIVDTVGHLARMYKYADVAVVGGGFNDGIHNILEPLTFGVPVFFGANHKKFHEGSASIKAGVGFEIDSNGAFQTQFNELIHSSTKLANVQLESKRFIKDGSGATKIISQFLNKIGQIISCQIC